MVEEVINGIKYRLDAENLTAEVTYKEDYEGDIVIPEAVKFNGVSYRVTSIGDEAFASCKLLKTVAIPDGVTSIGYDAFSYCPFLTSITIPDSVTSIKDNAFSGCESLTSIVVAEGNSVYDSRENCNAIIETSANTLICGCQNTIIPNSVTSIGNRAFLSCGSLATITIPESVRSIGDYAFVNCESLTSITIPESVTSIGDKAFQGCCKLADLTISDGVTTIGTFAFKDCKTLTSVTIPSSVKSIGKGGTFQRCTSLKLVQWDAINCVIETVDSEGNYYPPFYNISSIKNFTFGNNVKFIPACLCCGLSGLTSIFIPDSVTSIGECAFEDCTSLKAIAIPESVMIIEKRAFTGCKSLKIISIPSNVIIIEDGAFDINPYITIRYDGTVKQCKNRYGYWGDVFYGRKIYCSDGDVLISF